MVHLLKELHKHVLGYRLAAAPGALSAGQARPQAEAGAPSQGQASASWADQQREGSVRLRASLVDREAAGPDERTGASGPGDDAELSAGPEKALREFADRLEMLLEADQSEALAWGRHAALLGSRAFLAVPELAAAIGMLSAEKFAKMIAFLRSRACDRVRTNNHVERVNRKLRHQEKARYKWRKRRRIVRFLVLLLDRWWGQERAIRNGWREEADGALSHPTSKPPRRRRVA